ncbi:hypothetical protein M231_04301 [Tremella mesenterica]|uniref:Uncharacterized protein n=1 Tax=Tremella mesenterica TaxID=5217 RepID=A0A4Q1BL85_TREME|nr:uncharacterized protein TREMEDRAFT_59216 [Tremella mesenterica DSM 1558]EIW73053.1 hypothetical protein TREMEDRAFT_59216 [Tremella mesenterica DSM 1558]RXK38392.1 hypothetical protein M231_04301 [Tremella mesenterica]
MQLTKIFLSLLPLVAATTSPDYRTVIAKSDCTDIDDLEKGFTLLCPVIVPKPNPYVKYKYYFYKGDLSGHFKDTQATVYCLWGYPNGTYDDKTFDVYSIFGANGIVYN